MKDIKQQLIADIKITDGVVHGNSYYYNLFDCKTQKEKDVVRNAVNRLRKKFGDKISQSDLYNATRFIPAPISYGWDGLYTDMLNREKKYSDESRIIAIKIFFGVVAIAAVIYSYLSM